MPIILLHLSVLEELQKFPDICSFLNVDYSLEFSRIFTAINFWFFILNNHISPSQVITFIGFDFCFMCKFVSLGYFYMLANNKSWRRSSKSKKGRWFDLSQISSFVNVVLCPLSKIIWTWIFLLLFSQAHLLTHWQRGESLKIFPK